MIGPITDADGVPQSEFDAPLLTPFFLRAVEVWVRDGGDDHLRLGDGLYGPYAGFRIATESVRFSRGEGLPGRVWAEGRPVILEQFCEIDPLRSEAAMEADFSTGIGIPIIDGGDTRAVLVLLCGGNPRCTGVIETWTRGDDPQRLSLESGYYGGLNGFRGLSSLVKFPEGQGLPGLVWKTGQPWILRDLGSSALFRRARGAAADGLSTGVGLPVFRGDELVASVLFLSSSATPFAKAYEVWAPSPDDPETLVLAHGEYSGLERFAKLSRGVRFHIGEGLPGTAWERRIPVALESPWSEREFLRAEAAEHAGITSGIAIPVIRGERPSAVLTLLR